MRTLRRVKSATTILLLLFSACSRDQPIALPVPTVPTAPTEPAGPSFTLSGVVTDSASGRPVAGAHLAILPEPFPTTLAGWSPGVGVSDAAGHYTLANWPGWTGVAWVQASKDGYAQPCAASATIRGDTSLEIAITPLGSLAGQSLPTTAIAGSRTISGVVYEVTPDGRRPVANAWVGWEHSFDFVVADTRSDSTGRYLFCGLPVGRIEGIFAVKQGFNVTYISVDPGSDMTVDIEIKQR